MVWDVAMTRANDIREWALWLVGQAYEWGEESWYLAATPDPYDTDCSGLVYGVYRKVGIPWKTGDRAVWPRLTAHGYKTNAVRVDEPYEVGDPIFFSDNKGHAYHVALYVGNGETVEARGRKWGVVKYRLDEPNNSVLSRGGVFYRFPWTHIGQLEDDVDAQQDSLLKLNRLSAVASSYAFEVLEAQILGDKAQADRLKAERIAAVEAERKRLGLRPEDGIAAVSPSGGIVS